MRNMLIGGFLLVVLFCSSALAADIAQMGGKFGIGAIGSTPTIRLSITDSFSADLGLGYVTAPNNSSSGTSGSGSLNSLIFLNFGAGFSPIGTGGMNAIGWGVLGRYTSNVNNFTDVNFMSVGLTFGFETLVNPKVGLGAIIVPISYSNLASGGTNTSQLSILNEADIVAHLYF